ncbi:hypothetical protein JQ596_30355 [Bradyrhizobium manausense]|uniref:hypothetical protein n=1 Tax=Bradyrhizobium manausense TaxID=989370 RepID=UPI001BA7A2EE|nr:hypothetical protein [Bradyrhizobium manausense]MBR0829839.1 hypothetical protein [Bradyrhizobium manausense]
MIEDQNDADSDQYNPIEPLELTRFSKEAIKQEARKVLASESAFLKAAAAARNIGNASASLEPELRAVAGGLAFVAKDVGNLVADLLILASKALDAGRRDPHPGTAADPERGP